jgi:hypothetical protein
VQNNVLLNNVLAIIAILISVLMPLLLVNIRKHANKAQSDRNKLLDKIDHLDTKIDSHIVWHLNGDKK